MLELPILGILLIGFMRDMTSTLSEVHCSMKGIMMNFFISEVTDVPLKP